MELHTMDRSEKEDTVPVPCKSTPHTKPTHTHRLTAPQPISYPSLPVIDHEIQKPTTQYYRGPDPGPAKRSPANIGRRRQRAQALIRSPARPSHSAQLSYIFAEAASTISRTKPVSPFVDYSNPTRVNESRALHEASQSVKDSLAPSTLLAPPPSPALINAKHRHHCSSDEDDLNDLERAINMSFSPNPARSEGRRALNLRELKYRSREPSSEEWTGDEIYLKRPSPSKRSKTGADRVTKVNQDACGRRNSRQPQDPFAQPSPSRRGSRFTQFPPRSPPCLCAVGASVTHSMDSINRECQLHRESISSQSSDADDEDEERDE